eukprot:2789116-Prymnesium_polylepis.1
MARRRVAAPPSGWPSRCAPRSPAAARPSPRRRSRRPSRTSSRRPAKSRPCPRTAPATAA